MSIIATNSGGGSEPIPAGSYAARCYSMIQIGTNEENIMGKTKRLHKVRITWELPTEMKVFKEGDPEKPLVISKEFTLSMHVKSNLRKFLESWRGKSFTEEQSEAFDITMLLGKSCLLSVIHTVAKNNNTYAEVSGVNLLPSEMQCPDQINKTQELSYDKWNQKLFESLPDFIKNKIISSDEYKEMDNPHVIEDNSNEEDDLPF